MGETTRTLLKLVRAFETVEITPLDRKQVGDRHSILQALHFAILAVEAWPTTTAPTPTRRKDGHIHPERPNRPLMVSTRDIP